MIAAAGRDKRVRVHNSREVAGIRVAADKTATVLRQLAEAIVPGMTTLRIDQLASELIRATGGRSAFHNYRGFPGQICISVNDEVVHGIGRAERVICPGDIVSLDVGIQFDGYIGDTATTVCVGAPLGPDVLKLLAVTQESLDAGIAAARAGLPVNNIGIAVEDVVLRNGFSVVHDFVGHGCGCELHEPPEVANFRTSGRSPIMRPGMVLAIEPMVNAGTADVKVDADGWTVRTKDCGLSAHFEHMVLITNKEPEILTWPKKQ